MFGIFFVSVLMFSGVTVTADDCIRHDRTFKECVVHTLDNAEADYSFHYKNRR